MISSYILWDLVLLELDENSKDIILKEHPDTIASKYILYKRNNNINNNDIDSNINIITKIVLEYIETIFDYLPKDIQDSTVIHVRLGDVVAGCQGHEIIKRPLEVNNIMTLLNNDNNKKYIIGKCFFAIPSSKNYDECINLSNKYLENVINSLKAKHFDSGNADIDLCCAIKSKLFLQGRGYFSQLIVYIRKKLNLENIENECLVYK